MAKEKARQARLPGADDPLSEAAELAAELRGAMKDSKIRYDKAAEELFKLMVEEGVEAIGASGLVFRIRPSEPRLEVKEGTA